MNYHSSNWAKKLRMYVKFSECILWCTTC